jgi:hypothetical protein
LRKGWDQASFAKEVSGRRVTYGIEVGRWTGMFFFVYYADIFVDKESNHFYHTLNSFTKRGALKKARKYINRLANGNNNIEIYSYDLTNNKLTKIEG